MRSRARCSGCSRSCPDGDDGTTPPVADGSADAWPGVKPADGVDQRPHRGGARRWCVARRPNRHRAGGDVAVLCRRDVSQRLLRSRHRCARAPGTADPGRRRGSRSCRGHRVRPARCGRCTAGYDRLGSHDLRPRARRAHRRLRSVPQRQSCRSGDDGGLPYAGLSRRRRCDDGQHSRICCDRFACPSCLHRRPDLRGQAGEFRPRGQFVAARCAFSANNRRVAGGRPGAAVSRDLSHPDRLDDRRGLPPGATARARSGLACRRRAHCRRLAG